MSERFAVWVLMEAAQQSYRQMKQLAQSDIDGPGKYENPEVGKLMPGQIRIHRREHGSQETRPSIDERGKILGIEEFVCQFIHRPRSGLFCCTLTNNDEVS